MIRQENTSLIRSFVLEFRGWQDLLNLSIREHQLLVDCDAPGLIRLVEQKEKLLHHLAECRQQRFLAAASLERPDKCPGGNDSLNGLQEEDLRRLNEGIQAMASRTKALIQENFALADCSMKRFWALQSWMNQVSDQDLSFWLDSIFSTGATQPHETMHLQDTEFPEILSTVLTK